MNTTVPRTLIGPVHGFRPSQKLGRHDEGGAIPSSMHNGCHSGVDLVDPRVGEAEPGTHEHPRCRAPSSVPFMGSGPRKSSAGMTKVVVVNLRVCHRGVDPGEVNS